jgi:hypothetical protein
VNERELEHWLGISTFLILQQGAKIMAAIDDANNALATLNANVDALVARGTTNQDPAIETLAQGIQAAADKVAAIQ